MSGGSHLLRIRDTQANELTPTSRPGQFALLLAHPSLHLVRRPMSIHDEGDGWRSYMVKPVGPASRELVALAAGSHVDISPPLGNGFPSELGQDPLLLVGGGFGIAPMHFLARRIEAQASGPEVRILYGGRSARDIELDTLAGLRSEIVPSTDDGSLGFHGTCVDRCVDLLRREGQRAARFTVLTCGPHAMMAALYKAVHGLVREVYVSLEEIMACGVGVCMGCVTRTRDGTVPICTHGPVFRGSVVTDIALESDHV